MVTPLLTARHLTTPLLAVSLTITIPIAARASSPLSPREFESASRAQATQSVTVLVNETHQTIDSFGASDAWSANPVGLRPRQRELIAELLFDREKGIGLSGWRFNLGAGKARKGEKPWIANPWREIESFLVGFTPPGADGQAAAFQYDFRSQNLGAQWFLKAAHEKGVKTFTAFVNSPPRFFTRNGLTNQGDLQTTSNLKPGYEGHFARYLVDVLQHFDKEGLPFDSISPFNEPQWRWDKNSNQEGSGFSNTDIKSAVKELHAELTRRKGEFRRHPQIELIDSGEILGLLERREDISKERKAEYGDYLNAIFSDGEMMSRIAPKVTAHSYWSERVAGKNEQLVSHRQTLRKRLNELRKVNPKLAYWVTEFCILGGAYDEGGAGKDLGMGLPMQVARVMHADLTEANAAAWYFWTAISKEDWKDGLIYVDERKESPSDLQAAKLLWAFGNYSRFVRPGAVRLGTRTKGLDDSFGVLTSAWRVPREHGKAQIVVVAVNHPRYGGGLQLTGEHRLLRIGFDALAPDVKRLRVQPHITSPEHDLKALPAQTFQARDTMEFLLPPWSIVTFVIDPVAAS